MRLVRQFILDAEVEAIGPLSPAQIARLERTELEKAGAAAAKPRTKPLSAIVDLYLTEKELDNAKRAIYDKRRSLEQFIESVGDVDLSSPHYEIASLLFHDSVNI